MTLNRLRTKIAVNKRLQAFAILLALTFAVIELYEVSNHSFDANHHACLHTGHWHTSTSSIELSVPEFSKIKWVASSYLKPATRTIYKLFARGPPAIS